MLNRLFSAKRKPKEVKAEYLYRRFALTETTLQTAINESKIIKAHDTESKLDVGLRFLHSKSAFEPLSEIQIAQVLGCVHTNLARVFDVLEAVVKEPDGTEKPFQVLVVEWYRGGNLVDYMNSKGIDNKALDQVVNGILSGIQALHSKGFIHSNLNPNNVLIEDIDYPHVRLTDYALPRKRNADSINFETPIQLVSYSSPEQISPEQFGKKGKLAPNTDFWSLGLILIKLLKLQHPFERSDKTPREIATGVTSGNLNLDLSLISPKHRHVIDACLIRSAADRVQKASQLWAILSLQKKWENGQLSKIKQAEPQPIYCKHCGALNKPKATLCSQCDKPLSGMPSLENYRGSWGFGVFMVTFALLYWLPVGIIDWKLFMLEENEIIKMMTSFIEEANKRSNSSEEIDKALLVGLAAWLLFTLICQLLIDIFRTAWLSRINSNASAFWDDKQVINPWLIWGAFVLDVLSWSLIPIYITPFLLLATSVVRLIAYQRIWKASDLNLLVGAADKWRTGKGSFMIFAWWLSGILMPFLLLLHFLPTGISIEGEIMLEIDPIWLAIAGFLSASYWLLGIIITIRMSYRQRRKYEKLAACSA